MLHIAPTYGSFFPVEREATATNALSCHKLQAGAMEVARRLVFKLVPRSSRDRANRSQSHLSEELKT